MIFGIQRSSDKSNRFHVGHRPHGNLRSRQPPAVFGFVSQVPAHGMVENAGTGYRILDSGYRIDGYRTDGYQMTCQNNTEKPNLQTRLTFMYTNKNCLLLCDALTISFSLLFIVNGLL